MNVSRTDRIYQEFMLYNDFMLDKLDHYYMTGRARLIAVMRDGEFAVYNALDKSTRYYRPGEDLTDEHVWRKRFSDCLGDILYERHITQSQLSARSGITPVMISKYINGLSTPSAYSLYRLCEAIGCDESDMYAYLR